MGWIGILYIVILAYLGNLILCTNCIYMYIKPVMALMFKIINFLLHYRSKWFSLFIYLICINIKRALDLLEKLFYLNKNDTLFVDLLKLC